MGRTEVKDLLRRGWSWLLRWRARLSSRPNGLVVVYHALDERHGDPRAELVAPHGRLQFRGQLEHLARWYEPVAPSRVQAATARRRRGGRIPVAVTLDDDLRSHVDIAAPELRRAGVPAAFFLTGSTLDGPREFWWGPVQRASDRGLLEGSGGADLAGRLGLEWAPLPEEQPLRTFARSFEQAPPERRDAARVALLEEIGADAREQGLRAEHVAELSGDRLEVGFHTLRHDRMDRLDDDGVRVAVSDGRDAIVAAARSPVVTFSYPHGGVDERAARAVRDAGFTAAFTSRDEPVRPDADPMLLGRFYPTYESVVQFEIELARAAMK